MRKLSYQTKPPLLHAGILIWMSAYALVFAATFLVSILNSVADDFSPIGDHHKQTLIATSQYHTCALTKTTDAGVRCWGANNSGQLGDGTAIQRTSPVDVEGLSSGVAAVGVGESFSCALLTSGQVKCWGSNAVGQIGNSVIEVAYIPVNVLDGVGGNPITGVATLSVGKAHACVVFTSGGAKCWGANDSGQLGTGNYSSTVVPTDVTGYTSNVKTIDAGGSHSCLVTASTNEIFCFGNNSSGQLGNGTVSSSALPVRVSGITTAVEVSAGDSYSCARLSAGDAYCWGNNTEGTLGDGSGLGMFVPVNVDVIGSNARRISAGLNHTCATRKSDGEVMCWGRGQEGQRGDNTTTQRNIPTSTNPALKQAYDISARGNHTCAWMGTCNAKCWGDNTYGQLGNGTTVSSSVPASLTFCSGSDPTPTPEPEACASESACVPDSSFTTPLDPKPPVIAVTASTSKKVVTINLGPVRLGIPIDLGKRETLRKKLSKFFKRNITNLAGALKLLNAHFIVTIVKAPAISSSSFDALALPTKYKTETRKRRVTTRLGPGTYVAKVTVRLRDAKGRTFSTGKTSGQTRFSVR